MVGGGASHRFDDGLQTVIANRPVHGNAVQGLDHRLTDLPIRIFGKHFGHGRPR